MINERLLNANIESYMRSLTAELFFVSDLQKAVLEGCNSATVTQHPMAQEYADMYIRSKDANSIYTRGDIEKAYRTGAELIVALIERDAKKEREKIRIRGQEAYKMAQLTVAAQQMMDLGKQFMEEVEQMLRKRNNYRLDTKKDFNRMYKEYTNIRCKLNPIFNEFSSEEGYKWGEDGEALENAVREIFKIDKVWEENQFN